jgi:hypothetical protein
MSLIAMRAYSQINLIGQKLARIEGKFKNSFLNNIIDSILGIQNKVVLEVSFQSLILIRSRNLCFDITKEVGEEFNKGHLAWAVYEDFLSFVRKNNNLPEVYNWLIVRDTSSACIEDYTGKFNENEENEDTCLVKVTLDRESALRGENMLLDLEEFYPDRHFTLELILEIIFSDFINEYVKGSVENLAYKLVSYTERKK